MPDKTITVASTSDTQGECEQAALVNDDDLAAGSLPDVVENEPSYEAAEVDEMLAAHAERMQDALNSHPDPDTVINLAAGEEVPYLPILEQQNSERVVIHLAENPRDLRHLQDLQRESPARARDWIDKLSARLEGNGSYREFQREREKEEKRRGRDRI